MTDPTSDSLHNIENANDEEVLPGGWKVVEAEKAPTDTNELPFRVWQFFRPDGSLAWETQSEDAANGIKMVLTETANDS